MSDCSTAEAVLRALSAEMQADPRVVALGEDVGRGGVFGQYRGLQQRFGADRVIDTPISEAAIVGAGVGMALAGLRPVVEMRIVDFSLCAMDEIVNQAAKARFMFGGQGHVPLLMRLPIGIWDSSAAQHSQSFEAWFAHVPGLVVVCPGTPQDSHSLLRASLASGDPVIFMEHKMAWQDRGALDESLVVPLGRAAVRRHGRHLTMVSWSRQLLACEQACDVLAQQGLGVELIDLRTIWPWDRDTVLTAAARSGRVLIVHEAVQAAGFGAEVAATIAEHTGARVRRLGAPRIPVAYAAPLEEASRVRPAAIVAAALELMS